MTKKFSAAFTLVKPSAVYRDRVTGWLWQFVKVDEHGIMLKDSNGMKSYWLASAFEQRMDGVSLGNARAVEL